MALRRASLKCINNASESSSIVNMRNVLRKVASSESTAYRAYASASAIPTGGDDVSNAARQQQQQQQNHPKQKRQQKQQQQQQQRYVSPFQEIFNTIQEGKTFLGTTELKLPEIKYLKCGIPEHVLRFKTTAYDRLLEEPFVRPNEHRVTLQVDICHIPLENEMERMVLKEIVGSRLNDETGVLQLSSAQFGSRIENKRHVVSMLERIVESTRTLAARVQEEVTAATGNAI